MNDLFEESFYFSIFPLLNSSEMETVKMISTLYSISPNFFILNMSKTNVVFQTNTNNVSPRNIEKLKERILQITKHSDTKESPCYWLGFLAREDEKTGLPLDDYWNSCNTKGIDLDKIYRLLNKKTFKTKK